MFTPKIDGTTSFNLAVNPDASVKFDREWTTLQTMLRVAGVGTWKKAQAWMQLPNLQRCLPHPPKDDQQSLIDWRIGMGNLETHSHKMGTCLLTGQQAMVDVSSNPRTSLVLFSSVNTVFMVAIVMWISASFALFYIGGWMKTQGEFEDPSSMSMAAQNSCTRWLDDIFIAVAILWNMVPAILLLSRDYRDANNIPMNNAILSIAALATTILVQWNWANFHMYDMDIHEAVAKNVVMQMQECCNSCPPRGGGAAAAASTPAKVDSMDSRRKSVQIMPLPITGPEDATVDNPKTRLPFSTNDFLSTASMVRDHGLSYAR